MTNTVPEYRFTKPGALVAALPAILGFVPVKSLVLVTICDGTMGGVMRVDLTDELEFHIGHLARVAAGTWPDSVVAVFVDETGAGCRHCNDQFGVLAQLLKAALSAYGVGLYATHVVDRVEVGGRWRCVDGCGANGPVDDPSSSPLAVAAVLEGRRLYGKRSELHALIAVDIEREAQVAAVIDDYDVARHAAVAADGATRVQSDIEDARAASVRVAAGECLDDATLAAIGCSLTDVAVRDTLYALAVGDDAGVAEALWTALARTLPPPWRVEALVLLAFSAYARGDGPMAGISLEAALRIDPTHRMAVMLDQALQSAMPPERIRELARTGYELARKYGVTLPPALPYGQCAG